MTACCYWKYCQQHGGHFVWAAMWWWRLHPFPLDPADIWLLPMPALLPSTTAQSCPITLEKLSSSTLVSSQLSEHWAGSRELTGDMQHVINLEMTGIHSCHSHALSSSMSYLVIMHPESMMICYNRNELVETRIFPASQAGDSNR